jgi:hypothetical protein
MRQIVKLFWNEPAVAIGVLASVALAVLKIVNGGDLAADDVLAILAPLGTAAGVRPLVSPARDSGSATAGRSAQPEAT